MPSRWRRWPANCVTPTCRRSTPRWERATSSARHVVQRLVAQLGGDDEAADELAERSTRRRCRCVSAAPSDVGVAVPGAPGVLTKLAKCCTPVPGDNIMGFVTRGGGVSVHRTDCTNADVAATAVGADHRRAVGAVAVVGVPGGHPGRGAGPAPAAVGRDPRAGRREGQHPVRVGDDVQRPGGHQPVHASRWATPSTSATC